LVVQAFEYDMTSSVTTAATALFDKAAYLASPMSPAGVRGIPVKVTTSDATTRAHFVVQMINAAVGAKFANIDAVHAAAHAGTAEECPAARNAHDGDILPGANARPMVYTDSRQHAAGLPIQDRLRTGYLVGKDRTTYASASMPGTIGVAEP
jgi:hypothetical protein